MQEEAEEATELALAFEQEADDNKRDVEHLTKTLLDLKSAMQALKWKYEQLQKRVLAGGGARLLLPGQSHIEDDTVKKMYQEKIEDLQREVEMSVKAQQESKADDMEWKGKLAAAQRKLDALQKELDEFKDKAGCSVAANKGFVYLCNTRGQMYRRSTEVDPAKREKWQLMQGKKKHISCSEAHLWAVDGFNGISSAKVREAHPLTPSPLHD